MRLTDGMHVQTMVFQASNGHWMTRVWKDGVMYEQPAGPLAVERNSRDSSRTPKTFVPTIKMNEELAERILKINENQQHLNEGRERESLSEAF